MDPTRKTGVHFYRWVLRQFRQLPTGPRGYYENMARSVRIVVVSSPLPLSTCLRLYADAMPPRVLI